MLYNTSVRFVKLPRNTESCPPAKCQDNLCCWQRHILYSISKEISVNANICVTLLIRRQVKKISVRWRARGCRFFPNEITLQRCRCTHDVFSILWTENISNDFFFSYACIINMYNVWPAAATHDGMCTVLLCRCTIERRTFVVGGSGGIIQIFRRCGRLRLFCYFYKKNLPFSVPLARGICACFFHVGSFLEGGRGDEVEVRGVRVRRGQIARGHELPTVSGNKV